MSPSLGVENFNNSYNLYFYYFSKESSALIKKFYRNNVFMQQIKYLYLNKFLFKYKIIKLSYLDTIDKFIVI